VKSTIHIILAILFLSCLGWTTDSIGSDRVKIQKLLKTKKHQSISYSIARYIHNYGVDAEVKKLQMQWYAQLKKSNLDSSLFITRSVNYKIEPNAKRCSPGVLDSSEINAFEKNLNFVRLVAGLPKVNDIDKQSSKNCQKAAWCLTVNDNITHFIPKTYKCYTPGAASAASRANLSYGYSAGRAMLGMLRDEEKSNTSVGHRRWLLNPSLTFPGYGVTNKVAVVQVFGEKTNFRKQYKDLTEYEKRGIAWPVAGIHPKFLATKRFSFSLAQASFKSCYITVKKNGKMIRIKKQPLKANYGKPTIVFDVQENPRSGDTYQISIRNVIIKGKVKKNFFYSTTIQKI